VKGGLMAALFALGDHLIFLKMAAQVYTAGTADFL